MQSPPIDREERVSFTNSRGETLRGVLSHPSNTGPPAAVILCHGMESSKESDKFVVLSRLLAERGIGSLRFDFSYAGESQGKFEDITYSGEVDDLAAAFDFVLRYGIKKVGVLGSSMGGSVAVLFAAREKRVATLATIAAPVHPEKIIARLLNQEQLDHWRQAGFIYYHGRRINASLLGDLEKINILDAANKIACPVLVIHGDRDETVDVEEAHELYQQITAAKKICILEGADHRLSDSSWLEKATSESIDWIIRHLR